MIVFALALGAAMIGLGIVLWMQHLIDSDDSITRAPAPPHHLQSGERIYRPSEHPARHVLTDEGVFIPGLTPKERRLLHTTPQQWAEEAANEVARTAARAHTYARDPRLTGTVHHPWLRERAKLIADGHEQWLLWMEFDPKEDQ